MSILDVIQELCKEKNTNPSKVEIDLGLGKGTLYKWDKSSPSAEKLLKVANYFDVSMEYLMGTEDRGTNDLEGLEGVYLSLAKEASKNAIDPDDIRMAIKMIKEIRDAENKK